MDKVPKREECVN